MRSTSDFSILYRPDTTGRYQFHSVLWSVCDKDVGVTFESCDASLEMIDFSEFVSFLYEDCQTLDIEAEDYEFANVDLANLVNGTYCEAPNLRLDGFDKQIGQVR